MANTFVKHVAEGLGHMANFEEMQVVTRKEGAVLIHIPCGSEMQLFVDGGVGCVPCNFHSPSLDLRRTIGPSAHDSLFRR